MDNSTLTWILQAALGGISCILWRNLSDVKHKAEKAADDLANYKVFVAEKYITSDELRQAVDALNQAFERHASRMDVRLDKLEGHIMELKGK